ncbi:hypothetical protein ACF0H5_022268 [Mactra antiquata]
METENILQYLLEIVEAKGVENMAKLASLSIIDILLLKQRGDTVKKLCLKQSFTNTLFSMLEYGLNNPNDPSDFVCVSIAMEIISQFLKLPATNIESLVQGSIIRCLMEFVDTNSRFYKYPSSTKLAMVELCEGKQLMGKVRIVSMGSEPLNYIHKHADYEFARVPDRIKLCKLIDTETEEDIDIRNILIQQGLVWSGEFPGELKKSDNVWNNIIVTKVLNGGMFWAQVGDDTIKSVTDIQALLNSDTIDFINKSKIKVGDCVVVYGDIMGCSCYLRAQIKSYYDCHAEVFSIDFGHILTVHDKYIYTLPEQLSVKKVTRKISLCSLDGIGPPPLCEELVYNAAAILVNLCKQSLSTGEHIHDQDGPAILFQFIQNCEKPKLQAQVLTIIYNMISISKKLCGLYANDIVLLTIGIVKTLVDTRREARKTSKIQYSMSNDDKLLLARCVMVLTNVLYMQKQCRDLFYQNQGIDTIIRLSLLLDRKEAVYMMCIRVLKVFIGDNSQDGKVSSSLAMKILKQKFKEEQNAPPMPESDREMPTTTIEETKDLCDSDGESVMEAPVCRAPRQQISNTDKGSDSKKYYLGDVIDIYDDFIHEIFPEKSWKDIHQLSFAKHVCGMLNCGKGGTIYFGIDEHHVVFGLELTRDMKDQFRLGVDRLFNGKLTPILLHSKYSIELLPVYDPVTHLVIPDHYVLEIKIGSSRGVIYTMTGDGSCYYRLGSDTLSLSRQELRNLVVLDEESIYKDEIRRLQKLKQELLRNTS